MLSTIFQTIFAVAVTGENPSFSFAEYHDFLNGDKYDDWENYMVWQHPLSVLETDETKRRNYLKNLYAEVYLKDLMERHKIQDRCWNLLTPSILRWGVTNPTN